MIRTTYLSLIGFLGLIACPSYSAIRPIPQNSDESGFCRTIVKATMRLPGNTTYADWPQRIQGPGVESPKWVNVPKTEALDFVREVSSFFVPKDNGGLSFKAVGQALIKGTAKVARTDVRFMERGPVYRVYGIESPSISYGPISAKIPKGGPLTGRLWILFVYAPNAGHQRYFQISSGYQGQVMMVVDGVALLFEPGGPDVLQVVGVLGDFYPTVGTVDACPSIWDHKGGLK